MAVNFPKTVSGLYSKGNGFISSLTILEIYILEMCNLGLYNLLKEKIVGCHVSSKTDVRLKPM